jgi:formylglycine-generating enzyme required for sulfatase activity
VQDTAGAESIEIKTRVFISYSRKDMAFADKLDEALKARGFEVLIDREEIYAFENWWNRLQTLICSADSVVFVLSPDAVASHEALREVDFAASLNKRFAPIICRRVEDSAVPDALRRLNFVFFDDPESFEVSADHLAEALRTDIVWIREHTQFGETARGWIMAGRPDGLLLRTPALEMAQHWLLTRPPSAPEPTEDIRSFIVASGRAVHTAQQVRRIAEGSIFALMLAVIFILIGWINQDYIREQWRWYTVTRPYMQTVVRPYALSVAAEHALKQRDEFRECAPARGRDYCPEMVVIPSGSFVMGSPKTEIGRNVSEEPQHVVTIAKRFAVSKFAVTFDEWDACAAYGNCRQNVTSGRYPRGQLPVFNVTWDDAQTYVGWLSKMTGKPYRLLTEAEYEYAARAGTRTAFPWGDDVGKGNANCLPISCLAEAIVAKPLPVGSFVPNAFGLFDMVGNMGTWTQDCVHYNYQGAPIDGSPWTDEICHFSVPSIRVVRGGNFRSLPAQVRSATRSNQRADQSSDFAGFRIVRTIPSP